jgi:hypothetical protein
MSSTESDGGYLTAVSPFSQEREDERLHKHRTKEETEKVSTAFRE